MADDVSRLIGRLEAGFEAVIDRVNRSDEQTAQKFTELAARQEKDKNLAISAREAKQAEIVSRFHGLDEKVTTTFGLATVAYNWVTDKAPALIDRVEKIDSRVTAIEDRKKADGYVAKGERRVWNWIWGGVIAIAGSVGTFVTAILGLSPETIDSIKRFFHGG